MRTRALYDWVHENPNLLFYPADYTNDPGIIRQNNDMVAINSALAVDLSRQVCAEGLGGQMDFLRGAARSRRGRPVITLPSTAENGTQSRIVATLAEGSDVAVSRGDVHYVVTEYGIASLHGKSVSERARALIEIAHPDFRHELLEAAKTQRYVAGDLRNHPKAISIRRVTNTLKLSAMRSAVRRRFSFDQFALPMSVCCRISFTPTAKKRFVGATATTRAPCRTNRRCAWCRSTTTRSWRLPV
jgi:acyl-CoA hydrolase